MTFDPQANFIEDFEIIPNLKKFINGDPIAAFRGMATADALVTSLSCFSYLPAILNRLGTIVYYPHSHAPLKDWLVADRNGIVLEAELLGRLQSWKRQRSRTVAQSTRPVG
jgi:hypothetical protein